MLLSRRPRRPLSWPGTAAALSEGPRAGGWRLVAARPGPVTAANVAPRVAAGKNQKEKPHAGKHDDPDQTRGEPGERGDGSHHRLWPSGRSQRVSRYLGRGFGGPRPAHPGLAPGADRARSLDAAGRAGDQRIATPAAQPGRTRPSRAI